MEKIYSKQAPDAIGPYSQAIKAGDYVYISGQIGLNDETHEIKADIEGQTKQVMENLQAILKEAGCDFSQVVKTTIYLSDIKYFATVNDIYGSYLSEPYPARACVEVAGLPKDVLVEIEAVAYIG
ncbi:RidA family protein [Virgibacillus sp. 179-BFC.A HS]|uniref:RidA family protein n=1 Tax=Tigheibacillus jepli TaxID=3035914 RepID=A0ABU5CDP1_9BACI|nr:RidA family protein [Virgibacillus sp. 179-BFC.A HS]MDY0404443.1 RidA family protein [Virgibacillus sp. 179-BFC.A HS]